VFSLVARVEVFAKLHGNNSKARGTKIQGKGKGNPSFFLPQILTFQLVAAILARKVVQRASSVLGASESYRPES
jgi:hypothetical protein